MATPALAAPAWHYYKGECLTPRAWQPNAVSTAAIMSTVLCIHQQVSLLVEGQPSIGLACREHTTSAAEDAATHYTVAHNALIVSP